MNKATVRSQLLGLLNRNDCSDAQADIFIDQAVARIQRTLRVPPMERVQIYTIETETNGALSLPNDFLQLKHLYMDTGTIPYVDLGTFLKAVDAPGNKPNMYTRVQGSLLLKPSPPEDFQVTMVYYGEIPDLVNDADTNFVTEIAPDLLVYGALTFAADFFIDERKPAFEEVAVRIFNEIQNQAIDMEFAQEGMSIQSSYNSPEY